MNIFYNAGTYQDEVDEYNWIYNSTTGYRMPSSARFDWWA